MEFNPIFDDRLILIHKKVLKKVYAELYCASNYINTI